MESYQERLIRYENISKDMLEQYDKIHAEFQSANKESSYWIKAMFGAAGVWFALVIWMAVFLPAYVPNVTLPWFGVMILCLLGCFPSLRRMKNCSEDMRILADQASEFKTKIMTGN